MKCRLDALFIDRDSYDFELSLCLAKDLKAAVATELSSAFVGAPAPLPSVVSDIANFQRKAIVWDDDDEDHREAAYSEWTVNTKPECKTRYPLIVIASLVEKTPNLAGLCRTSEVLGASLLIVPNREIINTVEFKNMTATAHRWLEMQVVPPANLLSYIQALKEDDYNIVAVEQTATSVPLDEMPFPERCALLLGAEKTGIPFNLLSSADSAVEIPQEGVVRSLNVHVAGAACIWQYVQSRR